jgi:hypothetical protein
MAALAVATDQTEQLLQQRAELDKEARHASSEKPVETYMLAAAAVAHTQDRIPVEPEALEAVDADTDQAEPYKLERLTREAAAVVDRMEESLD